MDFLIQERERERGRERERERERETQRLSSQHSWISKLHFKIIQLDTIQLRQTDEQKQRALRS
jgi:hypothetical protein